MDTKTNQTALVSNNQPRAIRLIPNLSVAALQHGLDKELSMWYCLRSINHWGSGFLDLEYTVKELVDKYSYSRSTAYRILDSGDGTFWDKKPLKKINRPQIVIYSLLRVAKYLDIRISNYFLEIPLEKFVGNGRNRVLNQKSWLYASFHKPQGTKSLPISRVSIQLATGINRRSQQRYDKIVSIRVANYANSKDTNGKLVPIIEAVDGKSRQWMVHKRLGNTYYCRACRGQKGMLSKVNAAVSQSFNGGEACYLRRFFMSVKSFIKCHNRYDHSYIAVSAVHRRITRDMEWYRVNP